MPASAMKRRPDMLRNSWTSSSRHGHWRSIHYSRLYLMLVRQKRLPSMPCLKPSRIEQPGNLSSSEQLKRVQLAVLYKIAPRPALIS